MSFLSFLIPKKIGANILTLILSLLIVISCKNQDVIVPIEIEGPVVTTVELPKRSGPRPETTLNVPHVQIGVKVVPEVHDELFRRVFSLPGLENRTSVIGGWRGLWLTDEVSVKEPSAIIGGREFGHIHNDGSLHIFLEPARSYEAVRTCWAVLHPYNAQHQKGWHGFVMLYTPQSMEELNVTFLLIVDGYNYVTGQNLLATDFY